MKQKLGNHRYLICCCLISILVMYLIVRSIGVLGEHAFGIGIFFIYPMLLIAQSFLLALREPSRFWIYLMVAQSFPIFGVIGVLLVPTEIGIIILGFLLLGFCSIYFLLPCLLAYEIGKCIRKSWKKE